MGHSDSTVTLEVYSHFIPDTQKGSFCVKQHLEKMTTSLFFDGNLPFPASGSPSARIWQAILTNRGAIREKEYQKTPNAKLHSAFFGTPGGNRTHN